MNQTAEAKVDLESGSQLNDACVVCRRCRPGKERLPSILVENIVIPLCEECRSSWSDPLADRCWNLVASLRSEVSEHGGGSVSSSGTDLRKVKGIVNPNIERLLSAVEENGLSLEEVEWIHLDGSKSHEAIREILRMAPRCRGILICAHLHPSDEGRLQQFVARCRIKRDTPTNPFLEWLTVKGRGYSLFSAVAHFATIESLSVKRLIGTESPRWRNFIRSLRSLEWDTIKLVWDGSFLSYLRALETITVKNCSELRNLDPFRGLTKLRSLTLTGCRNLLSITEIESLTELDLLVLSDCSRLRRLTPIETLVKLRVLRLDGCDALSDVTPINHLAGLETLYLSGGKRLNDMVSLARLHKLRSLHWQTRGGLPTQLSVLSEVPMLEQMTLCGKTVEKIFFRTELCSLRYLDLSNCPDLVEIEGLPLLVTLETLKLNEWFPLSNLSLVRCLPKLRDVKLVATS